MSNRFYTNSGVTEYPRPKMTPTWSSASKQGEHDGKIVMTSRRTFPTACADIVYIIF